MRLSLLLLIAAAACSDGTAPAFAPCSATPAPASDLCGSWAGQFDVPGAALALDLRAHGDSVSGTGTYRIEAGRAGDLQVDGTYIAPAVHLRLHYDYGAVLRYDGSVEPSQHITGTLTDSLGHGGPLTFVPQ
jgi:hypothetical protein